MKESEILKLTFFKDKCIEFGDIQTITGLQVRKST